MTNTTESAVPSERIQRLIQIALAGGVIVFGAVAYYMSSSGSMTQIDPASAEIIQIAFLLFALGVLVGMLFLRKTRAAATEPGRAVQFNILGWALAEGTALFGAVILLISGTPLYYIIGLLLMLIAFGFFPVYKDSAVA